jgi:hypothetical protein
MNNVKTLVAAIAAASIAGILTELSVSKDMVQVVSKTEKQVCLPQINIIPYELRGYYRIYRPDQDI